MLTQPVLSGRITRPPLPDDDWYEDRYADRLAAGRRLAERLQAFRGGRALVLALPPGGVVVAGELARALRLPLDVMLARAFSAPLYPAVVAGAISEGGGLCFNRMALRLPGITPASGLLKTLTSAPRFSNRLLARKCRQWVDSSKSVGAALMIFNMCSS